MKKLFSKRFIYVYSWHRRTDNPSLSLAIINTEASSQLVKPISSFSKRFSRLIDGWPNRQVESVIFSNSRTVKRRVYSSVVRRSTVRTWNAVVTAEQSIKEDSGQSFLHCAQQIEQFSFTLFMLTDFGLRTYKNKLVRELKPNDHPMRLTFVNEPKMRWPLFLVYKRKCFSWIKLTFGWVDSLLAKKKFHWNNGNP